MAVIQENADLISDPTRYRIRLGLYRGDLFLVEATEPLDFQLHNECT